MSFVHELAGSQGLRGVKTVIVPLISIGNVPQLTGDLLINSFGMQRVGIIDDECIEPMCSSNVYGKSGELSFAAEVFVWEAGQIGVVQLRSKVKQNMLHHYTQHLAQWIKASTGAQQVIVLAAWDAAWLRNPDLINGVQYVVGKEKSADAAAATAALEGMVWGWGAKESGEQGLGEGLTLGRLLGDALDAISLPWTALGIWCNEGRNVGEAETLARIALAFWGEQPSRSPQEKNLAKNARMIAPISWKHLLEDPADAETMHQLFG